MQQDLTSLDFAPPAAQPAEAAPATAEPPPLTTTAAADDPEPVTGTTVRSVLAGLTRPGEPTHSSWRLLIDRHRHVLDPLESPASMAATLASRLTGDGWADGADDLREALLSQVVRDLPHLAPDEPLPDLPPPAQVRVLRCGDRPSNVLVVAPGGDWLAAADLAGTIGTWDARGGTPFHPPVKDGAPVNALVPAPDGTWLAAAHNGGQVTVRDPVTGTVLHTLHTVYGRARALGVDPAGAWLAAVDEIEIVCVWDMPAGTLRHTRRKSEGSAKRLVVDPGGAWLAAAGWGTIWRWDPVTGDELPSLDAVRHGIDVVAVDPAGRWMAAASTSGSGTIRLWDLTGTGRPRDLLNRARTLDKGVAALVVGPGGDWLAGGSKNGTIQICDRVTGTRLRTIAGPPGINALAVDPHGAWLASAGADGAVQVWDLGTGVVRHTLTGHSGAVNALTVDPAGAWLASAGDDGTVRIWDPAAPAAQPRSGGGGGGAGPVRALTAARDGGWSAWVDGAGDLHINGPDWHHRRPGGHGGPLLADPQGTWLASTGQDWVIQIWDPRLGVERLSLSGPAQRPHQDRARHLATDAAGQLLAAGGSRITLWSPTSGEKLDTLPAPRRGVQALAVSPDATWLAAGGEDGTVEIRGLPDWAVRHHVRAHGAAVRVLTAGPDGASLLSGGADGVLRAWDPDTGAERHEWTGHAPAEHGGVNAVAIDPGGRWTASGGSDGTVRVWDPDRGAAVHVLIGHRRQVRAVATSPDGRHLASVGADGTVRVWDPVAGTAVASLRVAGGLDHVVWTPLGLIAGGDQGRYALGLRP
jgi:WD40 repeat protein